jgi:hypothetical protein
MAKAIADGYFRAPDGTRFVLQAPVNYDSYLDNLDCAWKLFRRVHGRNELLMIVVYPSDKRGGYQNTDPAVARSLWDKHLPYLKARDYPEQPRESWGEPEWSPELGL